MTINARQHNMVKLIKSKERVSVKKLAETFYVSEMTVRRDLNELEKLGFVQRYNGGAVYNGNEPIMPIKSRRRLHSDEKKNLSIQAKKYLHNSACIYIDSSSTCSYIIPFIAEYKDVKIITNSVYSLLCASKYHIPCIIAGGTYFENDMCTVGNYTPDFLCGINPDVAFFSVLGISDDGIISDISCEQTAVRKTVMKNSAVNVFLLDSTKQHKKYPYTVCKSEDADGIILI